MNFARIYNESIVSLHSHVVNNPGAYVNALFSGNDSFLPSFASPEQILELQDDQVLNGFFLYSLLLDKEEQGTSLILLHHEPSQCECLKEALSQRNKRMEGTGQDAYAHACDKCFIVSINQEGVRGRSFSLLRLKFAELCVAFSKNTSCCLRWGNYWTPMLRCSRLQSGAHQPRSSILCSASRAQ